MDKFDLHYKVTVKNANERIIQMFVVIIDRNYLY